MESSVRLAGILAFFYEAYMRGLACVPLIAALNGCASTEVALVGQPRPPISRDRVQIYLQPPASKYVEIANLAASSRGSLAISAAGKIDKAVERLKTEAARLGANGILLHGVGDQAIGSVGAGIRTEMDSGHSPYGLGFGVSTFFFDKSADGVAIFVEDRSM
jgi:hypothetical protein